MSISDFVFRVTAATDPTIGDASGYMKKIQQEVMADPTVCKYCIAHGIATSRDERSKIVSFKCSNPKCGQTWGVTLKTLREANYEIPSCGNGVEDEKMAMLCHIQLADEEKMLKEFGMMTQTEKDSFMSEVKYQLNLPEGDFSGSNKEHKFFVKMALLGYRHIAILSEAMRKESK